MGGVNFSTVESKSLQLGDGKFEQGKITVPANSTVKAGTILKRDGEGRFAVAEDGDDLIAIVPFDLANNTAAAKDMGFRALISGSVRKDMLNLNGNPITSEQADSLRDFTMLAVSTTDVSRVNP